MVCALHITHCMEEIEFRKADNAQRVAMIKAVYERCIEKEFRPYWKENWEKALPLVKELVDMEYKVTRLLYSRTIHNDRIQVEQYLNLDPLAHNKEFVKQLMTIQSIWDSREAFLAASLGSVANEAIERNIRLFYESHMGEVPMLDCDVVKREEIRFLQLLDYLGNSNDGGVNMYSKTSVIDALVY